MSTCKYSGEDCLGMGAYYTHQHNMLESVWFHVMSFGLLMLIRTDAKEAQP